MTVDPLPGSPTGRAREAGDAGAAEPGLSIGEVAHRSGTPATTIRYYETLGLVAPVRRKSGRRMYDEAAERRLRAIAAAREAGFALGEIAALLRSQDEGTDAWRSLVEEKIAEVRADARRLRAVEAVLRDSLRCGCRAWDDCPLVLA